MVLQELSQRLVLAVRPQDVVARFGGEEFTVCLSTCELSHALSIAERIRQDVARQPFCLDAASAGLDLTVSIGVATAEGGIARDLLRKADVAMYKAKEAGRNKVIGYSCLLDETADS